MKNYALGLLALWSVSFLMVGCGSSSSGSACSGGQVDCDGFCIDPIAPTLAAIQSEVFEQRGCATEACHDSDSPKEMLDLSSVSASGSNLVGINSVQLPDELRVAAGDSDASYLVKKLLGVGMANGTAQMPLSPPEAQSTLCAPELDAIRQWIDGGAVVP